jgi:hypothetical protein
MVFAVYWSPMAIGGASWSTSPRNQSSGVPNRATAETCEATDAGIGPASPAGRTYPAGTTLEVVYPATAAPWE